MLHATLRKGDEIRLEGGGWLRIVALLDGRVKVKIALPERVRIVKATESGNNTRTTK